MKSLFITLFCVGQIYGCWNQISRITHTSAKNAPFSFLQKSKWGIFLCYKYCPESIFSYCKLTKLEIMINCIDNYVSKNSKKCTILSDWVTAIQHLHAVMLIVVTIDQCSHEENLLSCLFSRLQHQGSHHDNFLIASKVDEVPEISNLTSGHIFTILLHMISIIGSLFVITGATFVTALVTSMQGLHHDLWQCA